MELVKPLYVYEVAKLLQIHEATVRRWISEGKLRSNKIGARLAVDRESLARFMKHDGGTRASVLLEETLPASSVNASSIGLTSRDPLGLLDFASSLLDEAKTNPTALGDPACVVRNGDYLYFYITGVAYAWKARRKTPLSPNRLREAFGLLSGSPLNVRFGGVGRPFTYWKVPAAPTPVAPAPAPTPVVVTPPVSTPVAPAPPAVSVPDVPSFSTLVGDKSPWCPLLIKFDRDTLKRIDKYIETFYNDLGMRPKRTKVIRHWVAQGLLGAESKLKQTKQIKALFVDALKVESEPEPEPEPAPKPAPAPKRPLSEIVREAGRGKSQPGA